MDESKMKSLISSLTLSAKISLEEDDLCLMHPRYAQYKIKPKTSNQEERRKQCLQNQKEKRSETINVRRGIQGDKQIFLKEMELEYTNKTFYKKILKSDKAYKDWIMMSEWLIDVPTDFQENWICTICPEGRRVLLVAEKGTTKAYSRRGDFLMKFPSALPGGCGQGSRGHTIVDCIWHHPMRTFFLIDVLIWGVPLTNCEAELRFYWLSNKFSETPSLTKFSETNRHKFLLLHHKPVSQLQEIMAIHPPFENNFPKADGVLFFHKDSLYTSGKSPLVTWLKPFMIPHILNIPVATEYNLEKPTNYPDKPPIAFEKKTNKVKGTAEAEVIANDEEFHGPETSISMDIEIPCNTLSDIMSLDDDLYKNGVTSLHTVTSKNEFTTELKPSEAAEYNMEKPEKQTNESEGKAENQAGGGFSGIIANNEKSLKKKDIGMDIETPSSALPAFRTQSVILSENEVASQETVLSKIEVTD